MGKLFRFFYCEGCGKRHRGEPSGCGCGCSTFKPGEWYISYYAFGRIREEKVGKNRALAGRILKIRESEVAADKFNLKGKSGLR